MLLVIIATICWLILIAGQPAVALDSPNAGVNGTLGWKSLSVLEKDPLWCGVTDKYVALKIVNTDGLHISSSAWEGLAKMAARLDAMPAKVLSEFEDVRDGLCLDLEVALTSTISASDVGKCLQTAYEYVQRERQKSREPIFEGGLRILASGWSVITPAMTGSLYLEDGPVPLNSVFPILSPPQPDGCNVTASYPYPSRLIRHQGWMRSFLNNVAEQLENFQGNLDDFPTSYKKIRKEKVAINLRLRPQDRHGWPDGIQGKAAAQCLRMIEAKLPEQYVYESTWTCHNMALRAQTRMEEGLAGPVILGAFRILRPETPARPVRPGRPVDPWSGWGNNGNVTELVTTT